MPGSGHQLQEDNRIRFGYNPVTHPSDQMTTQVALSTGSRASTVNLIEHAYARDLTA